MIWRRFGTIGAGRGRVLVVVQLIRCWVRLLSVAGGAQGSMTGGLVSEVVRR